MARKRIAGSNCSTCGLVEQPMLVWTPADGKKIVLIAANPTADELEERRFSVHGAGKILLHCVSAAGLNLKAMHQMYVVPCYAPEGNASCAEFMDAVQFCEKGFEAQLRKFVKLGAKVLVPIGQLAAKACGIEGSILKIRGSVYEKQINGSKVFVIPVVDPDYIRKGNFAEELTMVTDLQKAARISHDGWAPPAENFVTHPTIEWLEAKLSELRSMKPLPLLACDTEGWMGGWHKHWMTGFAVNATDAFCIPWRKQGGKLYWETMEEQQRAQNVLQAICAEFPLMFQNAQFDVMVLHDLGITVKHIAHDTMLMHHMFHPELPHNLGYIASIYADTPYWKDIVLASEQAFNMHDDTMFRTYNMRDCVVLHQIFPGLKVDLEEAGLYDVYEKISIKLVHPTVQMQINGMRLLKNRLPDWQKTVDEGHARALSELRGYIHAPETFSPSSPYHVRWLFFGAKPPSYTKSKAQLASYADPGSRKKKTTAAYANLIVATETVDVLRPLERISGNLRTTATGALSTDKQALNKMRLAANRELERLEGLQKQLPKNLQRIVALRRVVGAVDRVLNWSRWQKLKTTYYDFKPGSDGRMHPSYPIHRTRTGRLASKGPNWQNLTGAVTMLFGPEKGNVFVKPDWSNVEMRVLSFASDDTVLQEQFASGKKIHDENVKVLFGVDRKDPRFDTFKRAAKTYVFGRGYGGGLYGIFERVSMQVPEAKLTFEQFKRADTNYRAAHPAYVVWADGLIRQAVESRTCTNAFGRRRIFLGDEASIKREILNTPIQGTAADIANICMIELQDWIDNNKTSAKIVLQQHDSIMVECGLAESARIRDVITRIMEQPFTVWGYTVSFPVETDICTESWGEHVKWEDWIKVQQNARSVRQPRSDNNSGGDSNTDWNPNWGLDVDDDAETASTAKRNDA